VRQAGGEAGEKPQKGENFERERNCKGNRNRERERNCTRPLSTYQRDTARGRAITTEERSTFEGGFPPS
jgi:hypothetical protein